MKRFIKTLAGKTILFVLCITFISLFLACVACVVMCAESGLNFYGSTLEELERVVTANYLRGSYYADIFSAKQVLYVLQVVYEVRFTFFLVMLGILLLAIACFVPLMYAAGRSPKTEEFTGGPLYKVPFDVVLFAGGICVIGEFCFAHEVLCDLIQNDFVSVCVFAGASIVALNVFLGLCMSAASRLKQNTFFRNTLIYRVLSLMWKVLCYAWKKLCKLCRLAAELICAIPIIWKTGVAYLGISFLELVIICATSDVTEVTMLLWLFEKILLLPVVLFLALMLRRLQKSGMALAGGDLTYHTDTNKLWWDFKKHGENLNRIAEGMSIAVEDRLKSERMKTELITNVSHDLKTPLTSIVNYAALIGQEECENPKVAEYAEVLVRQSEKLKRLIEDLVEASKASTGNLDVLPIPCDAAVFLSQAAGEYEEKLQKSELTLVVKQPEEELRILADGRRMWRIFDNLMNNACKYAQPGTRVYLSLQKQAGNAVITFKNISRDSLDMTEEELMERFTRGDSSRNTEGNGLGLSIAKSLAELQGGSLHVEIDGDLFKAILQFPLVD